MTTIYKTLWRAADDDIVVDTASFSVSREAAELYLDNPGFGGAKLWTAKVSIEESQLLDLYDLADDAAFAAICDLTGLTHPGAIGVDEWVPRISYELRDAGIAWVRVRESYPVDSETWIFVGQDDPEMTLADE